jgi:hypothetical protein
MVKSEHTRQTFHFSYDGDKVLERIIDGNMTLESRFLKLRQNLSELHQTLSDFVKLRRVFSCSLGTR